MTAQTDEIALEGHFMTSRFYENPQLHQQTIKSSKPTSELKINKRKTVLFKLKFQAIFFVVKYSLFIGTQP